MLIVARLLYCCLFVSMALAGTWKTIRRHNHLRCHRKGLIIAGSDIADVAEGT